MAKRGQKPPLCKEAGSLRTDGFAQGNSPVVVINGGRHSNGAVDDVLLRGFHGGLRFIGGIGREVFIGDEADAALGDAQQNVLAEQILTGIPLIEEPDQGVANVLKAGGQGDGGKIGGERQLLIGVHAQEPGLAGLQSGLGGAVAGVAGYAPDDVALVVVDHVYVRTNRKGESLCCVVLNGKTAPREPELAAMILAAAPQTVGVVLSSNTRRDNVILGDRYRTLWGQDFLMDELCGLRFKLSVPSFYQVNREQAEALYGKAVEFAELTGTETVLDLYCGAGTITLAMVSPLLFITYVNSNILIFNCQLPKKYSQSNEQRIYYYFNFSNVHLLCIIEESLLQPPDVMLFIHIHRHAGFKLHDEFVLVDSDFFNQPPDKRLVVFG